MNRFDAKVSTGRPLGIRKLTLARNEIETLEKKLPEDSRTKTNHEELISDIPVPDGIIDDHVNQVVRYCF